MKNKGYLNMELLRFTTAGSVDDGKSTLIGRLLYDSKSIFEDQYEAIENFSKKRGDKNVNLALLTDGLKSEREQGITIDVAYRYFATPKRKFIVADTPGHIQYTRNMITGASTANLALILIDGRRGITEQTHRHTFIASLLGIPHIVFCINKMDLIDYDENKFEEIKNEIVNFTSKLEVHDIRFIPISALNGDNVVNKSTNMDWYNGETLLHLLETIHIGSDRNHIDCRFPVQYVIRPNSSEYRGYAGRVAGGIFKCGDEVVILPSGFISKIKSIDAYDEFANVLIDEAFTPMSVVLRIEDDIDISRGDMIVKKNNQPNIGQDVDMMICWFNEKNLVLNGKYIIIHTTNEARCLIEKIQYKININTLHRNEIDSIVSMNDIAKITIRTTKPLFYDRYKRNRDTGSVILVDEGTNETVAAGMIV